MTLELLPPRVRISCDGCGRDYGWSEFPTLREAREVITEDGWLVRTRNDVTCPACRGGAS